ncbi:uncharacterized protein LOC143295976 [Babylonia areolata]|uniref:uncharacterized protein LOC143295976 n=1 Tax=Babylonia areolata TaxID=304850 RepID=UPI003FD12D2F
MLALVLMLCACVSLSCACSCPPAYGPRRFCRYDLIVHGTVIAAYEERQSPYDPDDKFPADSEMVYTIEVKEAIRMPDSLKGQKMVSLSTPMQFSMCGTRLNLDVEGIFFGAPNYQGKMQTGACHPNVAWSGLTPQERHMITKEVPALCANGTGRPTIGPPGTRP